ncbi:hypothetical protein H4582DRAFT_2127071 [Lactarius indigo]|nr:hypothetical protein H4582DRAFT_2127071 [Lactarius indigo]
MLGLMHNLEWGNEGMRAARVYRSGDGFEDRDHSASALQPLPVIDLQFMPTLRRPEEYSESIAQGTTPTKDRQAGRYENLNASCNSAHGAIRINSVLPPFTRGNTPLTVAVKKVLNHPNPTRRMTPKALCSMSPCQGTLINEMMSDKIWPNFVRSTWLAQLYRAETAFVWILEELAAKKGHQQCPVQPLKLFRTEAFGASLQSDGISDTIETHDDNVIP